jgi:hypothetical protein
MYHLSLRKFERLKHGITWILTPPYYERHQRTGVSHTNKVQFLNTLHLLRLCCGTSLACTTSACHQVERLNVLLDIDPPYYERHLAHWRISYKRSFSFSAPPFVTSCYFVCIIMHVPPQPVPSLASSIVLLEILTPPYYERHSALAYLATNKVSISQHPPFVTAVTDIIMHVPPQPVPRIIASKYSITT